MLAGKARETWQINPILPICIGGVSSSEEVGVWRIGAGWERANQYGVFAAELSPTIMRKKEGLIRTPFPTSMAQFFPLDQPSSLKLGVLAQKKQKRIKEKRKNNDSIAICPKTFPLQHIILLKFGRRNVKITSQKLSWKCFGAP